MSRGVFLGALAVLLWVAVLAESQDHPAPAAEESTDQSWEIPYPLPKPPQPEQIFHVPTGLSIKFAGMMDVLSADRVVYIGETHDNVHAHRVELAVIRELVRRFPGAVAVGMEMFRKPQQEALDRWTRGELTEFEFLKTSRWYDNWGLDYGYYREILEFARANHFDVVALNPPKKLEEEVSKTGLKKLPEELKKQLPEMGEPDPYQRESMKAVFGAHKATEGTIDSFLGIQILWEETMASRIVDYLKGPRGKSKRMVVIAGGWHVRYGFGIPKKVFRRMPLQASILLPVELSVPEEKKDQIMSYDLPEIPLLASDFFWMVPYEGLEKERVQLGVRLGTEAGTVRIKAVEEDFPAARAGIEKGSEFVSIDGHPVHDITDVQLVIRAKRPGDRVTLVLRHDGQEKTFVVELFRVRP
jgi:uncharacterized iron-regulated protein